MGAGSEGRALIVEREMGDEVGILFLSADPRPTSPLRVDHELRAIDAALRTGDHRDAFALVSHGAVRIGDLQGLLLRHRPAIVHFSGHGNTRSELVMENDDGERQAVPAPALEALFDAFKDHLRCVILNACYSAAQAQAIAKHIGCVIGMTSAIGDAAAIKFSTAFYQALAFGKTVEEAFELGRLEIDLHALGEQDTPKLLRSTPESATIAVRRDLTAEGPSPAALVQVGRHPRRRSTGRPAALHATPALKYGVAGLGLAACVAIAMSLFRNPLFAIAGLAVGFSVLGLMVVFAQVAARRDAYQRQARLFVWVCLALFTVWATGMTASVFAGWPLAIGRTTEAQTPSPAPEPAYRRVYYQGFSLPADHGAKMYADVWHLGTAGDWTATLVGDTYRLCNSAEDSTASYTNRLQNVVDDRTVDLTDGRVSVRVSTAPPNTTHSGAGLLFRSSKDASTYLAFILNPGPGVSLLQRRGTRLKVLWSDGIAPVRNGLTELRMEGRGSQVALYVDDKLVHLAAVEIPRGDVGVMAYSTGCFVFDDFTMYAPAPAPEP